MHIKTSDEQLSRSRAAIHISILLGVAFCIGIYLVSTMVLISKDGITFIEYAKNLEISPLKTVEREYQHPGYPILITAAHKIAKIGHNGSSLQSWIYSAQSVALIFRLLSVLLLYLLGKKIVGERFSFWAILILILLPDSAKLGSDALSDWPHIFFLSAGFLLLIHGATSGKWWLFGLSGLLSGMGYLIRPECAQIVVIGILWLGLQFFWSQRIMSKYKSGFALVLLLIGFLLIAGPYMKLKGAAFPKKQLVNSTASTQSSDYEEEIQSRSKSICAASFAPLDIAKALHKLEQRISETLIWFFVPALLIGMYKIFRNRNWYKPEKFFVIALITLNIFIMTLLYCKYNYMSRRHTLPLVTFTIFYIPVGLEALASWLDKYLSKTFERFFAIKANVDFWFMVLLVTGIFVCGPKLLKPIRIEKQGYRDAAEWFTTHTNEKDIIAAPDVRIGFYSGRRSVKYDGGAIPKEAQYVVKVFEEEKNISSVEEILHTKTVFSAEGRYKGAKVVIFRQ